MTRPSRPNLRATIRYRNDGTQDLEAPPRSPTRTFMASPGGSATSVANARSTWRQPQERIRRYWAFTLQISNSSTAVHSDFDPPAGLPTQSCYRILCLYCGCPPAYHEVIGSTKAAKRSISDNIAAGEASSKKGKKKIKSSHKSEKKAVGQREDLSRDDWKIDAIADDLSILSKEFPPTLVKCSVVIWCRMWRCVSHERLIIRITIPSSFFTGPTFTYMPPSIPQAYRSCTHTP